MNLDRRVTLAALAGAVGTFLASGVGWLIEPTNDIFTAGALSSLVAIAAFVVIAVKAWPAVLVVAVTIPLTITTARLVPRQPIQVMAAIALVVIVTVGMFLTPERWRLAYVVTGAVILFAHTALTGQPPETILSVGATSAVCFLIGAAVINLAFDETRRLHAERLDLFDLAPAFIAEDDWTEAERRVRELDIDDAAELRSYLLARPELVAEMVGTVRALHHNPALVETFGHPRGAERFNRVHGGSVGAFVEQLIAIVTDKPYHDYEYRTTTRAGGDIALALRSIVNRRHPGQTRVLLVAQDVTDQQDARIALEQAIRIKDEFVAGVSHELRTPLAGVVGLTASILEGDRLNSADRELLEMVSDQANEMARIIEDLLVASRGPEHPVAIELAWVDACTEVRAVAAGRDVTVEADGQMTVLADPGRLRQIIRNLATNAARYGEPPVEISVTRDGSRVRIDVSDSGEPIPEAQRERIFEPFQSSTAGKRHAGSVGLGLAVSRVLARRMGGDLTYHHTGRSVFRLELPAHDELELVE